MNVGSYRLRSNALVEQKTLGRYKILGELGRGAMGAVYRAVDPLIERDVAIKTLLPELPPEVMEEVRERFIREARSAGRLNHPNIVTIFDVGEHNVRPLIVMEYFAGGSLEQRLESGTPCPAGPALDWLEQAAGATLIGSPTHGANGDVTVMRLPGGLRMSFTGQEVRHADGRQLQKVGIQPEVVVRPTLAGLRAGKDEVLDRALAWLAAKK